MPEYLYPGVYVEEIDTGNKPIEGVSTSTAGFLGIAERGPVAATFITSYADFVRSFGSYYKDNNGNPRGYLAYAVEGFFLNGGLRCWIARVVSLDLAHGGAGKATPASATSGPVTISAAGPGAYGAQIAYWIRPASIAPADKTRFRLTVFYWSLASNATTAVANLAAGVAAGSTPITPSPAPTQTEDFDNLATDPTSSMYYLGVVPGASNLVTVAASAAGGALVYGTTIALLTGGGDGAALVEADFLGDDTDPTNLTGLAALTTVDEISLLCCPDESTITTLPRGTIAGQLQIVCENLKDRFAITQSLVNEPTASNVTPTTVSEYVAFYYPWLNVVDPTTNITTLIPPGGHIAGIYARSDTNENVAKDPANEQILGITSLQLPINNQLQAQLNPIGVNCLRYFKGQGNLVWGGRTTSSDPDWKYISVRRLFIYVEKSIQQGTQWVVFEPNDEPTWARVRRSVSDFLTGLWMQNMLQGATKDQAYFVRCDNTTMTQADIDNGRLIVVVGIAPVKPAEFVIFRIGQWTGGSSVTEG